MPTSAAQTYGPIQVYVNHNVTWTTIMVKSKAVNTEVRFRRASVVGLELHRPSTDSHGYVDIVMEGGGLLEVCTVDGSVEERTLALNFIMAELVRATGE